jgi:hypothetical protein
MHTLPFVPRTPVSGPSLNPLVKDPLQAPDVANVVIADQDSKVQGRPDVISVGEVVERPLGVGLEDRRKR